MSTTKRTISVRLDEAAARRLERAARLMKQSRDAFLGKAGDETARRVLLKWAVARYRQGERSLSQLADETGLTVEEIMSAAGNGDREAALAMFLASCRTVAETEHKPEFLRLAQEAARSVARGEPATARPAERC
ncbi:MAG TPA: hypothetical protein VK066_11605 [Chloroflexota bacterium]|nr:hypothetical protein [Chloroflexota bacterium]